MEKARERAEQERRKERKTTKDDLSVVVQILFHTRAKSRGQVWAVRFCPHGAEEEEEEELEEEEEEEEEAVRDQTRPWQRAALSRGCTWGVLTIERGLVRMPDTGPTAKH